MTKWLLVILKLLLPVLEAEGGIKLTYKGIKMRIVLIPEEVTVADIPKDIVIG